MVAWVASSGGVDDFDGVDGGGFDGVNGGFDGFDGVDGLGSSTQRALTWKSLCVPSGEDVTHSSSLFFV